MKLGYALIVSVLLRPGVALAQQVDEGVTLTFGAGVAASRGLYVG